jgi:hypothetical protein
MSHYLTLNEKGEQFAQTWNAMLNERERGAWVGWYDLGDLNYRPIVPRWTYACDVIMLLGGYYTDGEPPKIVVEDLPREHSHFQRVLNALFLNASWRLTDDYFAIALSLAALVQAGLIADFEEDGYYWPERREYALRMVRVLHAETRHDMMELLCRDGPITMEAVADIFKLHRGTVTKHMRDMIEVRMAVREEKFSKYRALPWSLVFLANYLIGLPIGKETTCFFSFLRL